MNKIKRLLSLMIAGMMAMSMMTTTVHAEEGGQQGFYEETNAYALKYQLYLRGNDDVYTFEYASPYNPEMTYEHMNETYTDRTGMSGLYNVNDISSYVQVYCVDQYTSIPSKGFYKRMNLEDSDYYSEDAAGLLRSIVLNGFPKVDLKELASAAGVKELTLGEAIAATQLAIWKASYGDQLIVEEFVGQIEYWSAKYKGQFRYETESNAEIVNGYAVEANKEIISQNIEAVYNYLMSLEPTAPQEKAVSTASFIDWDKNPSMVDNGDGTYDITVSATVSVVENEGDALTLSAVLGNYFTTVDLENGEQQIDLTIKGVPANVAQGKITLAIDGSQTVEDVYMFEVEGGREVAQRRIGYTGIQLPVHAEVTIEPERIINFWKTTKVNVRKDSDGNPIYDRLALSGIVFDLFFVAGLDDYVSGKVILPETIDVGSLGDSRYHYPDYTVTTDEEGKATVNLSKSGLPDGVYVVREREHVAIEEPVKPFYIMIPTTNASGDGWEYEITIEPKNTVVVGPEIKKDVIEIEKEESTNEEQRFSVPAGEEFTWIVRGGIPADIKDGKKYVISDTLDYRLTYAEDLVVKVEEATAEANNSVSDGDVLVENKDYTLTVSKGTVTVEEVKEDIKELKIELTAAGMSKVAKLVGDAHADYEIRVYFNTIIDGDVAPNMGHDIPNQATLKYINSVNFEYDSESDIPEVYTCGINLYKYDAKDATQALEGAVFKLAKQVEQSTEGATPLVTKEGTIYVVYEDFYTAIDPNTGELAAKADVVTTTSGGEAMLYGLAQGTYYLVEIQAPSGYNLLSYPVVVTLNESSHLNNNTVKVANSNQFELPETGGIGTTIFTVSGMMMLAAAVVVLVMKKKKEEV